MKLPNGSRAVVDIYKLTGYCLNQRHPEGRHKARVFRSALSLINKDADILRNALLYAAATSAAVLTASDRYGVRYQVDFDLTHHGRSATIRSGWIVRDGEEFARLTSCYVLEVRKK